MTYLSLIKPYRAKIFQTLTYIFFANILGLALPWGIKMIIDDVLIQGNLRMLNYIMTALVGVLLLRSYFNFLRKYTSNIIGEKIVCSLREMIYSHTQKLSILNIKKLTPSQIMTRITGDVHSIRTFVFDDAIDFIYAFFSAGLILVILLWINVKLTFAALTALPLFVLIYFRFIPKLRGKYNFLRKLWAQLTSRMNEALNGIETVRSMGGEDHEKFRCWDQQKRIIHTASKAHALNVGLWVAIEIFTSFGVIAVLWLGGHDVINQKMTVGELMAYYAYLGMLFSPIIRLVAVNNAYQEASAALCRINEIFEISSEIKESKNPKRLAKIEGCIKFENVSFGFSPGEHVLKNINFSIEKGEAVGIVGASGAGKTTLINLLLRFYDPASGSISVDGHSLRDLDLSAYRRHCAVVLQDDFLFSGTVIDNIRYGNFDASEREVIRAAELAEAHSFIRKMKGGYTAEIGERGVLLSSGQRQRIAIARAVLKNPSLLILDEATSSLDAMTENAIQKKIKERFSDKTIIMVAHRFSTIMEADKIIVLDQGRIVEMGPHNYLLKKGGIYSNLYFEQFTKLDQQALSTSK